ncbi:hypothetical protein [Microvirga yunnanensis]|nr:hypothetical protein [Microvirga sp. HBU65207]
MPGSQQVDLRFDKREEVRLELTAHPKFDQQFPCEFMDQPVETMELSRY